MNNYFIIGRTNVGKSYLFNLFSKQKKNLSIDNPHTTVDIIKQKITSKNFAINLYDSPGVDDLISLKKLLIKFRDLKLKNLIFIYVVKNDYNQTDIDLSKKIHSLNYPIYLYLNGKIIENNIIHNLYNHEFRYNENGFSSIYKTILSDNSNLVVTSNRVTKKISIFGKENTGKSTFFNKLINNDLSLTHKALHTTRDPVEWTVNFKEIDFNFVDTAGFIRSKSKRKRGVLESLSINQSKQSIHSADLIILMLDSKSESRLDLSLIGELQKKNKPFMILVNKIDLIKDKSSYEKVFLEHLSKQHNFFSSLNIYFISALKISKNKILNIIYNKIKKPFDFKTSYLNKIAKSMNSELTRLTNKSKAFKIFYITAFTVNNKNYFKIFSNFKQKDIKPNIRTFIRKMLIKELSLKGESFKVIYN